ATRGVDMCDELVRGIDTHGGALLLRLHLHLRSRARRRRAAAWCGAGRRWERRERYVLGGCGSGRGGLRRVVRLFVAAATSHGENEQGDAREEECKGRHAEAATRRDWHEGHYPGSVSAG